MPSISADKLTKQIAAVLRRVKEGEEIVVCEGLRAVAKIVPLTLDQETETEEEALFAGDVLRRPDSRLSSAFWKQPRRRISVAALQGAVEAGYEG